MKTLLILYSYHHKNTAKIADIFAETLDAQVKSPLETDSSELAGYDLVGFGSGIYDYKNHKTLLEFADKLPQVNEKKAFIFSTSGVAMDSKIFRNAKHFHDALREKLQSKGYSIAGEFNCPGFNTNSFLKYIGGMNKGRPNEDDAKKANDLAKKFLEK